MNNKKLQIILLCMVAIAGVLYFVSKNDDSSLKGQDADEQGIVLAVDTTSRLFPLEVTTMGEQDGEIVFNEKTLTVYWTEETKFLLYENGAQIAEDKPTDTDATSLKAETLVRVEGTYSEENVMTAKVIRILPGNPRGEPADNQEITE